MKVLRFYSSKREPKIQSMENWMQDEKRKHYRPWKESRGPIKAGGFTVALARSINDVLVAPIAILPQVEGDIVRPFKVGIGREIKARLRTDIPGVRLNRALHFYTRSQAYLFATAQPDAMRHDIDGNPVEPVSEQDRIDARRRFHAHRCRKQRQDEQKSCEADGEAAAEN